MGLQGFVCSERVFEHQIEWGCGRALSGPRCVSPRLAPLHQLLQPMASCARVVQCAEAVPTLLRAFFSAVTQVSLCPGPHFHSLAPWQEAVLEHRPWPCP